MSSARWRGIRLAEAVLCLAAAAWAFRPAWDQIALAAGRQGEPGSLLRWWLAGLLSVPPLLAALGVAVGATHRGFGGLALLLVGAAGTAANVVGAGRAEAAGPAVLLALVAVIRWARLRSHPLAVAGTAVSGFALVGLGYVAWVVLLLGSAGGSSAAGRSPGQAGSPAPVAGQVSSGVTTAVYATGLEVPWAVGFLDGETMLVTERVGRVRVVARGRLLPEPALTLPVAAVGEGGLLGLAVHPRYPARPWVYLYYTYRGGDGRLWNRVARFEVRRGSGGRVRLAKPLVLLDRIPGARVHDGGRVRFGPDGRLYVTTGDAGQPRLAADLRSLAGKILRLEDDGRVPGDNPFPRSPVWSFGHRNPQGLAWDDAGRLYAVEHGPTGEFGLCCRDEVNLIVRGGFYGWPYRAARTPAAGGRAPAPPRDPVATSGEADTWAPGSVAAVRWAGHAWRGDLLVTGLRGERLLRLRLAPGRPDRVTAEEVALRGYGRLRELMAGPDGCLYLTTSNRDGRGRPSANDDRVLKLCPAARSP